MIQSSRRSSSTRRIAWPARRLRAATLAGLVALVLIVFARTTRYGFVAFDDPSYVTTNTVVQSGITGPGIRWALTTSDRFYWHPVTWLSHMTDTSLYGQAAGGRHATNVAIHAATTLLVFAAFLWMTGAWWRSAVVAALFAVHPLSVEPVAWIAERKTVLGGLFWFATIVAYAWYARRPSVRRYLLVAAASLLGLMSKPDVVTLPLALLLLDVWPLDRTRTAGWRRTIVEKLPLAALSGVVAWITYQGQQQAGAMVLLAHVTFAERLRHAAVAYAIYLRQFVWPHPLAVFYPYPSREWSGGALLVVALLIAVTAACVALARRAPFLFVGWMWFLATLVPMIGLIQVGAQSHADRFMYIPGVGLAVAVVWGSAAILERHTRVAMCGAAAAVLAFTIAASADTRYWRTSVILLSHSIAVTGDNPLALHLLAVSLTEEGRVSDAVPVYRASLRMAPINPLAWYNLGLAEAALHDMPEAAASFSEAVRLAPAYGEAHSSLGAALLELHQLPDARAHLEAALKLPLKPDTAAHAAFDLGLIAAYQGDIPRARAEFGEALRLRPGFAEARINYDKATGMLQTQSPIR